MIVDSETRIGPLLDELEEAFNMSLNQGWFRVLAEGSPLDSTRLREVEAFFISKTSYERDVLKIMEIVLAIEEIISLVKRYMLPFLRDRLRVSGFYAHDNSMHRDLRVKYKLIACVFPHNIKRLESITGRIKTAL